MDLKQTHATSRIQEHLFRKKIHPKSFEQVVSARKSLHGVVPMLWMIQWLVRSRAFVGEAKGAHFTDVDGHDYIDFCLGDTGAMTGHAPEATVKAITEQIQKGITLMLPFEDVIWVYEEVKRRPVAVPAVRPDRDRRESSCITHGKPHHRPPRKFWCSIIVITARWTKLLSRWTKKARPCRAPITWDRKLIRARLPK
ncbi:hypothetical protein [Candidatus Villigracilis saccharophilus]|uniref:hypothetical protein n=1 Tax=Candidatus Villigracilis saccharophilus TaxID=3140684 RepID=UPI0031EAC0A9